MSENDKLTRACDHCTRRKIKCVGAEPCVSCERLGYRCLYTRVPKKKGRKSIMEKIRLGNTLTVGGTSDTVTFNNYSPPPTANSSPSRHFNAEHELVFVNHQLPDVPLNLWTRQDFLSFYFIDLEGNKVSFLDFYFQIVHPRLPCLSRTWLMEHLHDVPLYLFFGIYTTCCKSSIVLQYQSQHNFNELYDHCSVLFPLAMADLNPFSIFYVLQMAMYHIETNPDICDGYLAMAIRQCQLIRSDRSKTWISPIGNVLGNDEYTSRELPNSIYMICYFQDFYISWKRRLPFMIHEPIDDTLIAKQIEESECKTHLSFAQFYLPLVEIGRRIRDWKSSSKRDCVKASSEFNTRLDDWLSSVPSSISLRIYQESSSTSAWFGYLFKVYHFFKLLIHIKPFIDSIKRGNHNDKVVVDMLSHATAITDIVRVMIRNPGSMDIPYFYLNTIATSAIFTIILGGDTTVHLQMFKMAGLISPFVERHTEILLRLEGDLAGALMALEMIHKMKPLVAM